MLHIKEHFDAYLVKTFSAIELQQHKTLPQFHDGCHTTLSCHLVICLFLQTCVFSDGFDSFTCEWNWLTSSRAALTLLYANNCNIEANGPNVTTIDTSMANMPTFKLLDPLERECRRFLNMERIPLVSNLVRRACVTLIQRTGNRHSGIIQNRNH